MGNKSIDEAIYDARDAKIDRATSKGKSRSYNVANPTKNPRAQALAQFTKSRDVLNRVARSLGTKYLNEHEVISVYRGISRAYKEFVDDWTNLVAILRGEVELKESAIAQINKELLDLMRRTIIVNDDHSPEREILALAELVAGRVQDLKDAEKELEVLEFRLGKQLEYDAYINSNDVAALFKGK